MNLAFGWLSERLGEKLHSRELSRDQLIIRFDVILQQDQPIEQCPDSKLFRVFVGGKMKRSCFVLFIHWLRKQITNTNQNHFSRPYKNRSVSIKQLYHVQVCHSFLCPMCTTLLLMSQQHCDCFHKQSEQLASQQDQ